MSYTNGTTHYNLPLTTGADKRDWSDTNQAYTDVDAALYGAVQDTAQAELDIDALETRMDTAEQNIATNTGNIAGLDTRVTTVEGAITSLSGQVTDTRQDLEDMICAYNEASATSTHAYAIGDYFIYNDVLYKATAAIGIGDTIVPDTNCTTTNVTTELMETEQRSVPHLYSEYSSTSGTFADGFKYLAAKIANEVNEKFYGRLFIETDNYGIFHLTGRIVYNNQYLFTVTNNQDATGIRMQILSVMYSVTADTISVKELTLGFSGGSLTPTGSDYSSAPMRNAKLYV